MLRFQSDTGPSRLECYENEKKFNQNGQPRSVIQLSECRKIAEVANTKHQYTIGFHTNDDCYSLYAESAEEIESWSVAIDEVRNSKSDQSTNNG